MFKRNVIAAVLIGLVGFASLAAATAGIERFGQGFLSQISVSLREAAEKMGLELPTGTPIPGMSVSLNPDGSMVVVAPAAGLEKISRADLARDIDLGIMYLRPPQGSKLPAGFYKVRLVRGGSQAELHGSLGFGRYQFTFPTYVHSLPSVRDPFATSDWSIQNVKKICVKIVFDSLSVEFCIHFGTQ